MPFCHRKKKKKKKKENTLNFLTNKVKIKRTLLDKTRQYTIFIYIFFSINSFSTEKNNNTKESYLC